MKNKLIATILLSVFIIGWLASFVSAFEVEFFTDYFNAFRFLAEKSHLSCEDKNIIKLAAESSIEKFSFEEEGELVLVVTLNYYKESYNTVRSPDGNGHFYVFISDGELLEYAGSMEGASYRQQDIKGDYGFVTGWNIGENEIIESTYIYNGDYFKRISKILYEYKPDGSKTKVREYK
jgi:hypothetical protein